MSEISGLDMAPTINWYYENRARIYLNMPVVRNIHTTIRIRDDENMPLESWRVHRLISLFPRQTQRRSVLNNIFPQPPTWFRKDSTVVNITTTENVKEAISPTAIVPAYTDYSMWKTEKPAADIWLYRLEIGIVPELTKEVATIILSQAFVHEFAHTIVNPALYINGYRVLADKEVLTFDWIVEFANMAEKYPPISHYSSFYRGIGNKFESLDPNYDPLKAIAEELVESIAAFLLGSVYCDDEKRRFDPFCDRPDIKHFVGAFLNAHGEWGIA